MRRCDTNEGFKSFMIDHEVDTCWRNCCWHRLYGALAKQVSRDDAKVHLERVEPIVDRSMMSIPLARTSFSACSVWCNDLSRCSERVCQFDDAWTTCCVLLSLRNCMVLLYCYHVNVIVLDACWLFFDILIRVFCYLETQKFNFFVRMILSFLILAPSSGTLILIIKKDTITNVYKP